VELMVEINNPNSDSTVGVAITTATPESELNGNCDSTVGVDEELRHQSRSGVYHCDSTVGVTATPESELSPAPYIGTRAELNSIQEGEKKEEVKSAGNSRARGDDGTEPTARVPEVSLDPNTRELYAYIIREGGNPTIAEHACL